MCIQYDIAMLRKEERYQASRQMGILIVMIRYIVRNAIGEPVADKC